MTDCNFAPQDKALNPLVGYGKIQVDQIVDVVK
jgi:hypothetical protein